MQLQNFYAQDANGNIIPGATCSLFLRGTTTLATGLQDANGAPLSNPFSTSLDGLAQVAAPNGLYDLKIEAGLTTTQLPVTFADNLQALQQLLAFLPSGPTDPVARADGSSIQEGDRYYNTASQQEMIYSGSSWSPNNLDGTSIGNNSDPSKGASLVGFDGSDVAEMLINARPVSSYSSLRSYSGLASTVRITEEGKTGFFISLGVVGGYSEDYGTYVVSSGGVVWERQFDGDIHASWFEGANDSDIIQRAINSAIFYGRGKLIVDRDYICDTAINNRSNVRFFGSGSLSGDASYRVRVVPDWAPTGREPFQDMVPAQHLRAFSAASSPSVVICGSSTGTWLPDVIDTGGGVTPMLQRLITKYNPDKPLSFYNRCIGGQTFAQLNSKPSVFPAWYTDTGRDWLEYIADLAPDSVYIICGSNDGTSVTRQVIKSIIDKLAAFPKPPDVIFFTQPSVCLDPYPTFASNGTRAGQESRDYSAGLVRSMAQYYKKGLIDANRMGGIVLDGRDIMDNASMRILPQIPVVSGMFAPGLVAHDFSMSLNFNGSAAQNDAAFLSTSSNPVYVKIGAEGGNSDTGDIAFIQKTIGGMLQIQLFSGGASYRTISTTIAFPSTSFTLDVIKTGNVLTVSFNQSEDTLRIVFDIIACGGEMYPRSGYYNLSTGPWTQVFLNIGQPKLYKKLLTSIEAWGEPNSGPTRQLPYGGNGLNHFSSLGTREIYGRVMDTDQFRAATSDFGEYIPTFTPGAGSPVVTLPATAIFTWTRTGNVVSVVGVASISTSAVGGVCTFSVSLPIIPGQLSQLRTIGLINGTAPGATGAGFGDPTNKLMIFSLSGASSTPANFRMMFTYRLVSA